MMDPVKVEQVRLFEDFCKMYWGLVEPAKNPKYYWVNDLAQMIEDEDREAWLKWIANMKGQGRVWEAFDDGAFMGIINWMNKRRRTMVNDVHPIKRV